MAGQVVDAVVVDYDCSALLATVESLAPQVGKMVVVDNSERSCSRAALRGTRLSVDVVESKRNGGYGAGVNLGLRRVDSRLVVISNPDVIVAKGVVERLRDALLADDHLALVGPAILDTDGTPHQTARAFPSISASSVQAFAGLIVPNSRFALAYRKRNWEHAGADHVDWVSGAFFLARREALQAVGGFDEGYFMYAEEVDLCWRLAEAGFAVAYVPEAEVAHLGSVTTAKRPYAMAYSHHRSLWRFARMTARGRSRRALPLVAAGLAARFAIVVLKTVPDSLGGRRPSTEVSQAARRLVDGLLSRRTEQASVTVCLATRNGEVYLADQLASIERQSLCPMEVLISDDGSTDSTMEILENFASRAPFKVTIFHHDEPIGQAASISPLIESAKGDLVALSDHDDVWHETKLAVMASLLAENPAMAGAFCNSNLIDRDGALLPGSYWRSLSVSMAELDAIARGNGLAPLLRRNIVASHALVFRRNRVSPLLPIPDGAQADWWIAVGLTLDGSLLPVQRCLVSYRLHSEQAVGLRSRTSVEARLRALDPRERSRGDARMLSLLRERAQDGQLGLKPEAEGLLVEKISHSEHRGNLPQAGLSRLVSMSSDVAAGRYHSFANGWRSVAMDLFWSGKRSRHDVH